MAKATPKAMKKPSKTPAMKPTKKPGKNAVAAIRVAKKHDSKAVFRTPNPAGKTLDEQLQQAADIINAYGDAPQKAISAKEAHAGKQVLRKVKPAAKSK
jgi:hypothetical protein